MTSFFALAGEMENYDNLKKFAEEAQFVQFKKQFDEISITNEQRQELLTIVNELIKKEYKHWRQYRPVEPIASAGKSLKNGIKAGYVMAGIFGLIVPIAFGFVLRNYYKGKNNFDQQYNNLSNTYTNYLTGYMIMNNVNPTAATGARAIDRQRRIWFSDIVGQIIGCSSSLLLSILLLAVNQLNKSALRSYKRWKKATKIKQLIEPNKLRVNWRLL